MLYRKSFEQLRRFAVEELDTFGLLPMGALFRREPDTGLVYNKISEQYGQLIATSRPVAVPAGRYKFDRMDRVALVNYDDIKTHKKPWSPSDAKKRTAVDLPEMHPEPFGMPGDQDPVRANLDKIREANDALNSIPAFIQHGNRGAIVKALTAAHYILLNVDAPELQHLVTSLGQVLIAHDLGGDTTRITENTVEEVVMELEQLIQEYEDSAEDEFEEPEEEEPAEPEPPSADPDEILMTNENMNEVADEYAKLPPPPRKAGADEDADLVTNKLRDNAYGNMGSEALLPTIHKLQERLEQAQASGNWHAEEDLNEIIISLQKALDTAVDVVADSPAVVKRDGPVADPNTKWPRTSSVEAQLDAAYRRCAVGEPSWVEDPSIRQYFGYPGWRWGNTAASIIQHQDRLYHLSGLDGNEIGSFKTPEEAQAAFKP